jgi:cyclic pyranopterin phosphate synthase
LCLHSNREIDLKKYLYEGENLEEVIREAILSKEKEHELEKDITINRNMNEIGG